MGKFSGHVSALASRAVTFPKLVAMAIALGISIGARAVLGAFVDVAKDKAEGYASDWAASIFQNQTAQWLFTKAVTFAVRYPTTAVVAVFLVMLLAIVAISAKQVGSKSQPNVESPQAIATPTPSLAAQSVESALKRALPHVVIQHADVVNIVQRGADEYEAILRVRTLHATVSTSSRLTAELTITKPPC